MACLEMRKGSRWWYGRWTVKGKTIVQNLDVEIEEPRPGSINEQGTRQFERSRQRAQAKLESMIQTANESRHASELVHKLHRIQTGNRISSIALGDLAQAWLTIPRRKAVTESQKQRTVAIFERLRSFMKASYPAVLIWRV